MDLGNNRMDGNYLTIINEIAGCGTSIESTQAPMQQDNSSRTFDEIIDDEIEKLNGEAELIAAYNRQLKTDVDLLEAQRNGFVAVNNIQWPNAQQPPSTLPVETLDSSFHFITQTMDAFCSRIQNLVNQVLDSELVTWKQNQRSACNGGVLDAKRLDILQNWCAKLTQIVWRSITQVKEIKILLVKYGRYPNTTTNGPVSMQLSRIYETLANSLRRLVCETMIVEQQPPQVIKIKLKMTVRVRSLLGPYLGQKMNQLKVTCEIVNEAQSKALMDGKAPLKGNSNDISNNVGVMTYDEGSKNIFSELKMQLKKIKHAEKKGSESVVEELFFLYIHCNFKLDDEFNFHLQALSLPVTVIVHCIQEPQARATVFWYNAFAKPHGHLFDVPEKVEWCNLALHLNTYFLHHTKKALSSEALHYLAQRLFNIPEDDYTSKEISRHQFCKAHLPGTKHSFWGWLYSIIKLIKDHLKQLWENNHIKGFICKTEAENLLCTCPPGTFLVRFSESTLGGVTIAYATGNKKNPVDIIGVLKKEQFSTKSLADLISSIQDLQFLYPNIPKRHAFPSPTTKQPMVSTSNGYKGLEYKPQIVSTDLEENPQNESTRLHNTFGSSCIDISSTIVTPSVSLCGSSSQSRDNSRRQSPCHFSETTNLASPQSTESHSTSTSFLASSFEFNFDSTPTTNHFIESNSQMLTNDTLQNYYNSANMSQEINNTSHAGSTDNTVSVYEVVSTAEQYVSGSNQFWENDNTGGQDFDELYRMEY